MSKNGKVKRFSPDEIIYFCIERGEVPHEKVRKQASVIAQKAFQTHIIGMEYLHTPKYLNGV